MPFVQGRIKSVNRRPLGAQAHGSMDPKGPFERHQPPNHVQKLPKMLTPRCKLRLGDHFNNLAGLYKAAQIAVHSVEEINQGLLGYGSSAKPNDLHVRYWLISIVIFYQRRSEIYEILSCLIL